MKSLNYVAFSQKIVIQIVFFNKCLKKFENTTKPDSQDKEVDDYA